MFWDDHNPPHFHAYYGEEEALIDITTLSVFTGRLSPRALGLVMEWTSLHQQELLNDWHKANEQQPLEKIDPLR